MQRDYLMRTNTMLASLAGLAVASASFGGMTIADLASEDSVFVFSVDNAAETKAAFDRTSLSDIWNDPQLQAWWTELQEDGAEDFAAELERLGLEPEDLKPPKGTLGVAAWFTDEPVDDTTFFIPLKHDVLIVAEYQDEAEAMVEKLVGALEIGEEDGEVELDIDGDVYTWSFVPLPEMEDDADDEWGEWEDDFGGAGPWEDGEVYEQMHMTERDGYVLLSSSRDALEDAVDRLGGGGKGGVLAENDDYNATAKMFGETAGHFAVLSAPVLEKMDAVDPDEAGAMMSGLTPIMLLDMLGIANVKGFGGGFALDTDDGIIETRYAALAPKKTGLLSLIGVEPIDTTAPAFISGDAASVSAFSVKYDQIFPLLNQMVASLPDDNEMKMQMQGQLPMAGAFLSPLLTNMGPETYVAQSFERPFSATSQKILVAIKAKDEPTLVQSISMLTMQMGMQPRAFQGGQIWEMPAGGLVPFEIAVGVGAGHAFFGETAGIENAMRQAGAGAAALNEEPGYAQAARTIDKASQSYSWADMPTAIEYMKWTTQNKRAIAEAQVEMQAQMWGGQMDEQMKQQMIDDMVAMQESPLDDFPAWDALIQNLGDSVGWMKETDQGFVGRYIILRPNAN
ncbi:MAG: hypothetical protein AAGD00_00680 [Planctomycetota bacterium]